MTQARNLIEHHLPCMPDQASNFISHDIAEALDEAGLIAHGESERGNRLDAAREAYFAALNQLQAALADICGTDDHHVVQHRDGKPPWCPHCGRNSTGTQIKDAS